MITSHTLSHIASSCICYTGIDESLWPSAEALTVINWTMALLFALCSHGNNVWCLPYPTPPSQGSYDHQVTGLHFLQV